MHRKVKSWNWFSVHISSKKKSKMENNGAVVSNGFQPCFPDDTVKIIYLLLYQWHGQIASFYQCYWETSFHYCFTNDKVKYHLNISLPMIKSNIILLFLYQWYIQIPFHNRFTNDTAQHHFIIASLMVRSNIISLLFTNDIAKYYLIIALPMIWQNIISLLLHWWYGQILSHYCFTKDTVKYHLIIALPMIW